MYSNRRNKLNGKTADTPYEVDSDQNRVSFLPLLSFIWLAIVPVDDPRKPFYHSLRFDDTYHLWSFDSTGGFFSLPFANFMLIFMWIM
jgi:hypothetical protein